MKAFSSLVLLYSLLPLSAVAESASIQSELKHYDELSRSLVARVGKAERNAKFCYKNLPAAYQAVVQTKGVFGMFDASKKSLEENREQVKSTFEKLLGAVNVPPNTSKVNAGAGGSQVAAKTLAANALSVAEAKGHITELETKLKKIKKDLANPSDRKNIEYLVDCGDPTAVRNVGQAMNEFDQLVGSHARLSRYLKDNEAALASGAIENLSVAAEMGEVAKK